VESIYITDIIHRRDAKDAEERIFSFAAEKGGKGKVSVSIG